MKHIVKLNKNIETCMFAHFLKRNRIPHHRNLAAAPCYDSAAEIEEEARCARDSYTWNSCLRNLFDADVYNAYKSIDKPPYNDPELVRHGLHPFRRIYSQYAHEARTSNGFDNVLFNRIGLCIFPNYLPDKAVDGIREEFEHFKIGVVNKQQHNIIAMNEEKAPNMMSALHTMKDLIVGMISKEETDEIRLKYFTNTFAQRVENDPNDNDNQKKSHVDTFFPAIKWWYFPDEVKVEHGPLCYAKNSCYPYDEYLDWIYQESMKCLDGSYEDWKLKDHEEGSFRASDKELQSMGLEVKPVTVKENTLVIANVAGFHRRGDTKVKHVRNAIHGSIRLDNPFEWSGK